MASKHRWGGRVSRCVTIVLAHGNGFRMQSNVMCRYREKHYHFYFNCLAVTKVFGFGWRKIKFHKCRVHFL